MKAKENEKIMYSKLFPRKALFFDLFDQHIKITAEAIERLTACISSNLDLVAIAPVKTLEHQADIITRQCAEALHTTFITPFDRDQIFLLISRMDDIIDLIDGISDCLMIYKLNSASPDLLELAILLQSSIHQVGLGVKGLRNLKNREAIRTACREINRLEHDADAVLHRAIGRLFQEETNAREIIKWKEIYEILETGTDRCADVADVIEGILLEND
jgi:uncharacterized protein